MVMITAAPRKGIASNLAAPQDSGAGLLPAMATGLGSRARRIVSARLIVLKARIAGRGDAKLAVAVAEG